MPYRDERKGAGKEDERRGISGKPSGPYYGRSPNVNNVKRVIIRLKY